MNPVILKYLRMRTDKIQKQLQKYPLPSESVSSYIESNFEEFSTTERSIALDTSVVKEKYGTLDEEELVDLFQEKLSVNCWRWSVSSISVENDFINVWVRILYDVVNSEIKNVEYQNHTFGMKFEEMILDENDYKDKLSSFQSHTCRSFSELNLMSLLNGDFNVNWWLNYDDSEELLQDFLDANNNKEMKMCCDACEQEYSCLDNFLDELEKNFLSDADYVASEFSKLYLNAKQSYKECELLFKTDIKQLLI